MSANHPIAKTAVEVVPKLYELLEPLSPDERQRAVKAVTVLLGDPVPLQRDLRGSMTTDEPLDAHDGISAKAASWIQKNGLTVTRIEHVFSIEPDTIDVIAAKMPGKSKRQQTVNAYLICGVKSYLKTGEVGFNDKDARELCQKLGCYDSPNHSNHVKAFKNFIGGSKDSGWKLTNPGLTEAGRIVKELTEGVND